MKFKLNHTSLLFLNNMLRNPMALPIGMVKDNLKHYQAKDTPAVREILSLQVWMKNKVAQLNGKEIDDTFSIELSLRKPYIKRILDMMEHYVDLGKLPICAEGFWRLKDSLEGRCYDEEIDKDLDKEEVSTKNEVQEELAKEKSTE